MGAARPSDAGSAGLTLPPLLLPVQGLRWVLPGPQMLAVLASPSLLLLWDARGGGSVVWKRDLSTNEVWGGMLEEVSRGCAGDLTGALKAACFTPHVSPLPP